MKYKLSKLAALFILLLFSLSLPISAFSAVQQFQWTESECEIQDELGNPLTNQYILLIGVGLNGVIDPPDGDGVGGDDVLLAVVAGDLNPNYIDPVYLGGDPNNPCLYQFEYVSDFSNVNVGDTIYLRAYNSTDIASSTYYGNSPIGTVNASNFGSFDATPSGAWQTDQINPYYTSAYLSLFEALPHYGGVLLHWISSTEMANAGFRVFRSESPEGPFIEVSTDPIPSKALEGQGAEYFFFDWTAEPGKTYWYLLQDIPYSELPAEYGPEEGFALESSLPEITSEVLEDKIAVTFNLKGFNVDFSSSGHTITIDGFELSRVPGQPQVPQKQLSFGIPPDGDVYVVIKKEEKITLSGMYMEPYEPPPVPNTLPGEENSSPPNVSSSPPPSSPVFISSIDVLRSQRMAHIILSPVIYNQREGTVTIYTSLEFDVIFEPSKKGTSYVDAGYENIYSSLKNYGEARDLRITKKTSGLNSVPSAYRVLTKQQLLYKIPLYRIDFENTNSISIKGLNGEVPYLPDGNNYALILGGEGDGFYSSASAFMIYPESATLSVNILNSSPQSSQISDRVECEREISEKGIYQLTLPDYEPEEKWVWTYVQKNYPFNFNFNLPNYAGEDVILTFHLINPYSYDSKIALTVNSTPVTLPVDTVDANSDIQLSVQIPSSVLQETDNSAVFEVTSGLRVIIKSLKANYTCLSNAQGNQFVFSITREGDYAINFEDPDGEYVLVAIEGDKIKTKLTGGILESNGGGWRVSFHLQPGSYLFAPSSSIKELTPEPTENLPDFEGTVDYVVIGKEEFYPAALSLMYLREQEGMNVAFVSDTQIYDNFARGNTHPEAIRQFLKYAFEKWNSSFALLLGDTSYDCFGIYEAEYGGEEGRCLLPTIFVNTLYYNTAVPSDTALASFEGDDFVPDIAVGRLPVKDNNELSRLINVIINYETSERDEKYNRILFFADNDSAFDSTVDWAKGLLPQSFTYSVTRASEVSPDEFNLYTRQRWSEGALILNYVGHGSISSWGYPVLFESDDLSSFTTSYPPLFFPLTCLNGYYANAFPSPLPLGEAVLLEGDAIASYVSSGFTVLGAQSELLEKFYEAIFSKDLYRIGQADVYAKTYIKKNDVSLDVQKTWTLLGDPALRLKVRKLSPIKEFPTWPPQLPGSENKDSSDNNYTDIPAKEPTRGPGCTISEGQPFSKGFNIFIIYLLALIVNSIIRSGYGKKREEN